MEHRIVRRRILTSGLSLAVAFALVASIVFGIVLGFQGHAMAVGVPVTDELTLQGAVTGAGIVPTTIDLENDITLTATLVIPSGADITLTTGADALTLARLVGAAGASTLTVAGGGKLTLDGIVVTHPIGAVGDGMHGVLINSGGTLVMDSGEITGNYTTGAAGLNNSGAGVYINGGTFTLNDGDIHHNTASGSAGAVAVGPPPSRLTMNGGYLRDNVAVNGGGGAVHNNGDFVMYDGVLDNNSAVNGGAVYNNLYNHPTGTFTIKKGRITNNIASNLGGGIANGITYNGTLDIQGGLISGNKAAEGAGVYSQFSFTMSGGIIENNEATGTDSWGGGILSADAGTAYPYTNAYFTMTGGIVRNNKADFGAGIYIYEYGRPEHFSMTNGEVSGNIATKDGGGIYHNSNATFKVIDSIVANNTAAKGGGIYIATNRWPLSKGEISGTTEIVNNIANGPDATQGAGGGIFTEKFANLVVADDVKFSGNVAPTLRTEDLTTEDIDGSGTADLTEYNNNIGAIVQDAHLVAAMEGPLRNAPGYNNFDINYRAEKHLVTVNDSHAAATGAGAYATDGTVTINAGTRTGYVFTGWTVESGGVTLADSSASTTTFSMPGENVVVTANWEATTVVDPGATDPTTPPAVTQPMPPDTKLPPTGESNLVIPLVIALTVATLIVGGSIYWGKKTRLHS